jgi:hypothetical protein
MFRTIFRIGRKHDSPEKLAAVEGIDPSFYQSAEDINSTANAGIYAVLNAINASITWADSSKVSQNDYTYCNLLFNLYNQWLLEEVDEVVIHIERYKSKRKNRTVNYRGDSGTAQLPGVQYKVAGFKKNNNRNYNINRPTEIQITAPNMELAIGQEFYFKRVLEGGVVVKHGVSGGKYLKINFKPSVYLQFKLRVKKGENYYYSNPFCKLKMFIDGNSIRYKSI